MWVMAVEVFVSEAIRLKSGFIPNTISTDLHTGSMNAGMKDQLNVMSKFLNIGMNLQQVIAASTWLPAKVIHKEDLGHISTGAVADVAIFSLSRGNSDISIQVDLACREIRNYSVSLPSAKAKLFLTLMEFHDPLGMHRARRPTLQNQNDPASNHKNYKQLVIPSTSI